LKETKPDEHQGLLATLLTPVLIVDVVAVFLFCLGWTYIYFLYYHFGINVHALDIPLYYFFIYAYPVIAGNMSWFIAAILVVILFSISFKKCTNGLRKKFSHLPEDGHLMRCAIAVYLMALFPLSFYLAHNSAENNAADMRSGNARTIRFIFKEDAAKSLPADLIDANNSGKLKLLTQTPNTFIVFLQPDTEEEILPFGSTYVVFNADINLATIRMGNIRRKE